MRRPKVSVIVPIYKAEKYIDKCVQTLFNQTLEDIEYIFIDDCSPDKSIEIIQQKLKEFPYRESNIKIIRHNKNKGVGESRQDGIKAAEGEYIIHCDPDDWVELDMYEQLYKEAQASNADVIICDYKLETGKITKTIFQQPNSLDNNSIITDLCNGRLYGSLWNKLVRKKTIDDHNINLIKGLNVCEDLFFFLQLYQHNIKTSYLSVPLYHYDYVTNPNSIQRNSLPNHIEQDEKIIEVSTKILHFYPKEKEEIIAGAIFHLFKIQNCSSNEFYRKYSKFINIIPRSSLSIIDKGFLLLSLSGFYNSSKSIYLWLQNLKRKIKQLVQR